MSVLYIVVILYDRLASGIVLYIVVILYDRLASVSVLYIVVILYDRLAVMSEGEGNDIGNLGVVQWKLCLCLLLAWILVALFVCKGIKSSGKVSYAEQDRTGQVDEWTICK